MTFPHFIQFTLLEERETLASNITQYTMDFIELTNHLNKKILINIDHIECIIETEDETSVYFKSDTDNKCDVTEKYSEIISIIESQHPVHRILRK